MNCQSWEESEMSLPRAVAISGKIDGSHHPEYAKNLSCLAQPAAPHKPSCGGRAFDAKFVRSIREFCLDRLILFGERSWHRVIPEFITHYHPERNLQGLGNRLMISHLVRRRQAPFAGANGSAGC